ncbi:unnamed protein product [Microthlaspi erraticum]|uniref:GATA-type domain-containing protein n=1 Tax=Microthlaspi erraticum TaxID=1685480 RepID=A0A6D2KUK9_9BRAS|nr:unnamed protein product [Microthlaspi erraticum]
MTQGQYCHSCGVFYHHSHICCYEMRDGGSNIQNRVLVSITPTHTKTEYDNHSSSSSSSSVDCTLSLGTPSTRLSGKDEKDKGSTSSSISNFSDTSKTSPSNALPCYSRGVSSGSDSLLDHRCTNCDTTSTPLWRNGPRGPKLAATSRKISTEISKVMTQPRTDLRYAAIEMELTANRSTCGDFMWRDNESCV